MKNITEVLENDRYKSVVDDYLHVVFCSKTTILHSCPREITLTVDESYTDINRKVMVTNDRYFAYLVSIVLRKCLWHMVCRQKRWKLPENRVFNLLQHEKIWPQYCRSQTDEMRSKIVVSDLVCSSCSQLKRPVVTCSPSVFWPIRSFTEHTIWPVQQYAVVNNRNYSRRVSQRLLYYPCRLQSYTTCT